jgi:hypothetical protein
MEVTFVIYTEPEKHEGTGVEAQNLSDEDGVVVNPAGVMQAYYRNIGETIDEDGLGEEGSPMTSRVYVDLVVVENKYSVDVRLDEGTCLSFLGLLQVGNDLSDFFIEGIFHDIEESVLAAEAAPAAVESTGPLAAAQGWTGGPKEVEA